jgi:hypothetical protein
VVTRGDGTCANGDGGATGVTCAAVVAVADRQLQRNKCVEVGPFQWARLAQIGIWHLNANIRSKLICNLYAYADALRLTTHEKELSGGCWVSLLITLNIEPSQKTGREKQRLS